MNNPHSLQENLSINFGLNKQKEAGPNPLVTGPLWNRWDQVGHPQDIQLQWVNTARDLKRCRFCPKHKTPFILTQVRTEGASRARTATLLQDAITKRWKGRTGESVEGPSLGYLFKL